MHCRQSLFVQPQIRQVCPVLPCCTMPTVNLPSDIGISLSLALKLMLLPDSVFRICIWHNAFYILHICCNRSDHPVPLHPAFLPYHHSCIYLNLPDIYYTTYLSPMFHVEHCLNDLQICCSPDYQIYYSYPIAGCRCQCCTHLNRC